LFVTTVLCMVEVLLKSAAPLLSPRLLMRWAYKCQIGERSTWRC
jgi:hypothetical protein